MWDNIIIGKGDKGCSSYKPFDIEGEHSISDNRASFWINHNFLKTGIEIGITLMKDTDEGMELQKLVDDKVGLKTINKYLDKLVMKNLKPHILRDKITEVCNKRYNNGREDAKEEVRRVLGVQ